MSGQPYQPDLDALRRLVERKYVSVQPHPTVDLRIWNYTPKTQFERAWDTHTRACRGLITDRAGNVRSRPFEKFFNLGEIPGQTIPDEPFEVYEKLDGSLGIAYHDGERWAIASRGSFLSDQATGATQLLYRDYADYLDRLNPNRTYLFEFIAPWNRIVVDYGTAERLVLLAVIDTATGEESPPETAGWPDVVERHSGLDDLFTLAERDESNREGYVVRFAGGLRLKVKFQQYRMLHRVLTGWSTKALWELVVEGGDPAEIPGYHITPPEFRAWAESHAERWRAEFVAIEGGCRQDFARIAAELGEAATRKDWAERIAGYSQPAVLFRMLDRKPYDAAIWKQLKPRYARPFKVIDFE